MTCFDIAIVDDTDLEFIEEFRVELTTGGIPADSATVYIRENDEGADYIRTARFPPHPPQ